MHFEILVEDQSGKKALEILVPKIIGKEHTFRVIWYRGIGRIPKNLKKGENASKRLLLEQLPRLLQGYGKTFAGYQHNRANFRAVVIIVCDLDDKCLKSLRQELYAVLNACNPQPKTRFCLAIEEGEAWLLGDIRAVKSAYPQARETILHGYVKDSICGTWEKLADAVYPGGVAKLSNKGWQAIGAEKSVWAEKISLHMDVANNASPSFAYFRKKLFELSKTNI